MSGNTKNQPQMVNSVCQQIHGDTGFWIDKHDVFYATVAREYLRALVDDGSYNAFANLVKEALIREGHIPG